MTRRGRLRIGGSASVPVVLPHVIVRYRDVGTVTVTLDGVPVSDGPVPRVQLGEAIGQIVEQLGTAIRVEVHDPDGSVHADILTPPAQQSDDPPPAPDEPRRRDRPQESAVSAGGFEPGETVHVAITVTTTAADTDGNLNVHLDPKLACRGGRAVLVGAASGTTHVRESA